MSAIEPVSEPGNLPTNAPEAIPSPFISGLPLMAEHAVDPSVDLKAISPIALAYLGDAVFDLYMRTYFLWPPQKIQTYHQAVVAQVKAEQQAKCLGLLTDDLTIAEQDIVRRGRNASLKRPRRVSPEVYQQATGLEALLGYLYLADQSRLLTLLERVRPMKGE